MMLDCLKEFGWKKTCVFAAGVLFGTAGVKVLSSKDAKKVMPSASDLKMYWGDLHNHCNLTYGHGEMRDAFEAAKGHLA